jgi:hypothetical protein
VSQGAPVAHAGRRIATGRDRRLGLRSRLAPSAGLALLLAGGALAVRVTVMTVAGAGEQPTWLFTAAALVLAGVALVLVALPKIVPAAGWDDESPGGRSAESSGG